MEPERVQQINPTNNDASMNHEVSAKLNHEVSAKLNISSFLDEFNQEFKAKELTKYTKLVDLPKNINYKIKDLYKITTRYGEKYAIDLSTVIMGTEHSYTTVLPDRYSRMTDVQRDILKSSPNIALRYEGKISGNHSIKFTS